jgi:hypothetical protein
VHGILQAVGFIGSLVILIGLLGLNVFSTGILLVSLIDRTDRRRLAYVNWARRSFASVSWSLVVYWVLAVPVAASIGWLNERAIAELSHADAASLASFLLGSSVTYNVAMTARLTMATIAIPAAVYAILRARNRRRVSSMAGAA